MKKNNQNPSEWLAILHNSFNLTGIIFLTVILAENSINDSFWSIFPLIMFFIYGILSGLVYGENSKYILFRKSFWIVLLVVIWVFVFLGILSVEKENVDFWEYLNIAIRGIYSAVPVVVMYFLVAFLVGYMVAIFAKILKNLILKLFDYATKHETKSEDKFAIFHCSLILTFFCASLLILFEDSLLILLVFLSTGSSLYGILSGIFRKKEAKNALLRKPFPIFFLTLILLILVLPPIIIAGEKEYFGSLTEELLMSTTMVAMAELTCAVIPFIFGLLLGNIVGLVFFIYNKFIYFFNKNSIYNSIYKIFIKLVIIFVSGIYIGTVWLWISLLIFDGFYSPIYVFGLHNQDKYYQNHIGKELVKYGQEYEINDINTLNWKSYKDNENKFQFKYPENLKVKIANSSNVLYYLDFNDHDNNLCSIEVDYGSIGVSRIWLPEIRSGLDYDIKNNNEDDLWYFYSKDGKIFNIHSTKFEKRVSSEYGNYQFTSAKFISDEETDKFVKISDGGNKCPEYLIKGILGTFEFVK